MIIDPHVHSNYSDGLNSPETMAKQAKIAGLDGFALVDHDTVKGLRRGRKAAKKYDLEFIPGLEVSCFEGHLVVLGIKEKVKKGPVVEVIEKVRDLGGVSIAAHPYDIFRSAFRGLIKEVKFDYIETFNSRTPLLFLNAWAERVAKKYKLKEVYGSDAHWFPEVGFGSIRVDSIEDLYRGKAVPYRKKWAGILTISAEKTMRVLRKFNK